eukprot:8839123-Pyramimonas_sp.AAC.1
MPPALIGRRSGEANDTFLQRSRNSRNPEEKQGMFFWHEPTLSSSLAPCSVFFSAARLAPEGPGSRAATAFPSDPQ